MRFLVDFWRLLIKVACKKINLNTYIIQWKVSDLRIIDFHRRILFEIILRRLSWYSGLYICRKTVNYRFWKVSWESLFLLHTLLFLEDTFSALNILLFAILLDSIFIEHHLWGIHRSGSDWRIVLKATQSFSETTIGLRLVSQWVSTLLLRFYLCDVLECIKDHYRS